VDAATAYPRVRARILALVQGADPDTRVPACPSWTVRDVVAHLTGVTADVLAGRVDGAATDPWTAAQVGARRHRTLDDIVAEWESNAPAFDPLIPSFGLIGGQLLFDAWSHEQDLRGALGEPGDRDTSELASAFEFLFSVWKPPVTILAGDLRHDPGREPAAVLRTSEFELLRLASGRRSEAQVAALDWEPEPRPDLVRFDFFGFRDSDLVE
jgi:uncharacterized protein (TIGR03083 family)